MLSSPRRRRRLLFAAIAGAVATPLIFLGVHFSNPGSPRNANGPYLHNDSIYRQPKHVPFTAPKRRAVRHALRQFIRTAVARNDVVDSWALAGPSLRVGMTRRSWATGDIPVQPYPVARHGQGAWDVVQYSYRNKVGLEVLLFPKPGSGYSVATVDTDFVRGHDGRWRVNYWMITKFHGPGTTAPADSVSALSEGPGNVHRLPGKKPRASKGSAAVTPASGGSEPAALGAARPTQTSGSWMLIPLALLSLAIVVPIGIGTYVWLRNKRAERAYLPSR